MKFDVLLYRNAPSNLDNLPEDWPAQVREVPDNSPAPSAPWIRMASVAELEAYKQSRIASYNSAIASKQTANESAYTALENQLKSALNSMTNAENAWGSLTTPQQIAVLRLHNQILLKILPWLYQQFLATQKDT